MQRLPRLVLLVAGLLTTATAARTVAQLIARTMAPNTASEGISLSLDEQVGTGRGDWFTEDSASFIINRDPFRAIRRGRQVVSAQVSGESRAGACHR